MGKKPTKVTTSIEAPVEASMEPEDNPGPKVASKGSVAVKTPGDELKASSSSKITAPAETPAAEKPGKAEGPVKKGSNKILVVYYSFEGNTKMIADSIAAAVGADMLRLEVVKEQHSHGFIKYLWGGRQVVMKSKPKLVMPFDKHVGDYDVIFIGTPVWAFNFAPALRTFFSTVTMTGKKIALFCSCGGDRRKTFENMRAQLPGNEFLGEFEAVDPLKRDLDGQRQRAAEWAKKMLE